MNKSDLVDAPVWGFLPSLAALWETDQDPNPTSDTLPPPFKRYDFL